MNLVSIIKSWFCSNEPQARSLIIAAQVIKIDPHPNADRLRVITLNSGDKTVYPVVCGANNFSVGHIVVLALPGANIARNLHDSEHKSFTLSEATIRGVTSQGMICAAFEIGKSEKLEDGIMILPQETKLGSAIS